MHADSHAIMQAAQGRVWRGIAEQAVCAHGRGTKSAVREMGRVALEQAGGKRKELNETRMHVRISIAKKEAKAVTLLSHACPAHRGSN